MTLQEVRKITKGCPCEEVANKEYCEYCGYLNKKFGWDCRYCENLRFNMKWRDPYACRRANKAMHDYEKGDTTAFYMGNAKRKMGGSSYDGRG
jgi:hypothetical protein